MPLSSILTAERRPIASPSSPSPSPVSDNGAETKSLSHTTLQKRTHSFREIQIWLLGIGLWDNLLFSHVFNKQFPVIFKLLSLIRLSVCRLGLCSSPLFTLTKLNVFISLLHIWLCSLPVLADADTMCDTWRSTAPHGQEAWSPNVFGLMYYLFIPSPGRGQCLNLLHVHSLQGSYFKSETGGFSDRTEIEECKF